MTFDVWLLLYAVIGAAGGLLIGLIGTGSSLVMMPVLVLLFPVLFPEYDALRLAIGTTVATMTIGAVVAAITHRRQRNIENPVFRGMVLPYIAGALTGPWLAKITPSSYLKTYIMMIIVVLAVRMLAGAGQQKQVAHKLPINPYALWPVSALVALVSSMAGIASGMLMIPYLQRFNMPMLRVIGTSTAGAAIYCVAGLTGYVWSGWSVDRLPPGAIGFVYLPAFVGIGIFMAFFVPLGVRIAHRVDDHKLQKMFAFFLLIAAVAILLNR